MALVKCEECGKEISTDVKACPHCGKRRPSKDVGIGVIALAFLGMIWFLYHEFGDSTETASAAASAPTANRTIYTTTATQLNKDYATNEVATDSRIGNDIINISGAIMSIDKDFTDSVVLLLSTGGYEFDAARLQLVESQRDKATRLSKGQHVVANCDKVRRVMGSPFGYDCVLTIP